MHLHIISATKSHKSILCLFAFTAVMASVYLFQARVMKFYYQYVFEVEPLHDHGQNYTKWIVVTSISEPTKDIEKLAQIKGWKLLVVADKKTPVDWYFPGCIFLSVAHQEQLGYGITRSLPYNSYTRKNIGYLYAIQHGARYIYDTDDDNCPTDELSNFHMEPMMSGLIYDDVSQDVMNPYSHFGQPSIWPRGYPLQSISTRTANVYKLGSFRTPVIQQGLVNGDPDVDAIFRLTRKKPHEEGFNISFDQGAPPFTLSRGVFAPFNSQNTFFSYGALWALYLPSSVAFRVTDIWRGYWAQRLLWLLGQQVAFFPPNAVQVRNPHDYLEDFLDEDQFYRQTASLVQFLKSWTCPYGQFFACVGRLGHDMATAEFWKTSDADLIDQWLEDLQRIGYREPMMAIDDPMDREDEFRRVYFSPNLPDVPPQPGVISLSNLCNNSLDWNSLSLSSQLSFTFSRLVLVIVFNFPYHQNIGILEALYREHFPIIVYCSQISSYESFLQEVNQGPIPLWVPYVSIINITMDGGLFGYECAIRAIEMNHRNIDGYVILGDDVLLNFWNFRSLPTFNDVAHFETQSYSTVDRNASDFGWMWWPMTIGKVAINRALSEIAMLASNATDSFQRNVLKTYLQNREVAGLNTSVISISQSDFYHIPLSVSRTFAEVAKVYLKHKVFLEIAVPTIMVGLHPRPHNTDLRGLTLWGTERKAAMSDFDAKLHYLHPLKLSELLKDGAFKEQYCHLYIAEWLRNY